MANILVVDDHEDTRAFLRAVLEGAGHTVSEAGSVEEARAACAVAAQCGGRFDLVIADLDLPDGDMCDALPELMPGCTTRAVALTAQAYPADVERCRRAGFACHLAKPIEVAELESAVADALGGGRGTP